MTTVIECMQNAGRIHPLDTDKLAKWKEKHRDGDVFDMILDDGTSTAISPLAKKFHAIRDEYAAMLGYDKEHAKVELKYLHGVYTGETQAPIGRTGRLVDYHGRVLWFLSIRDYTTEELQALVAGSDLTLQEASI